MKEIIFDCKIITPLFMGGAHQQPKLRTQSFNGLFRYWFRLLGGSIEDERKIFGWGGKKANKGLIQMSINHLKRVNLSIETFSKKFDNNNQVKQGRGLNYIGFSLDTRFKKEQINKPRRNYLKEENRFSLILRFHPKSNDDDIKKTLAAVWCSFYLGNFGSRGRRGFGSIIIENTNGDIPTNFNIKFTPEREIGNWLIEELNKIESINYWQPRESIPYIFENLQIYKVNKNNISELNSWIKEVQSNRSGKYLTKSWDLGKISGKMDLLDFLGFMLMAFRSYYEPDYSIAKKILEGKRSIEKNETINRMIFGLPLNFYFSSIKKSGELKAEINHKSLRRASPLIFKIIEFKNNFDGFILIFKATEKHNFRFLPDGAKIMFKGINIKEPKWEIIEKFIAGLISRNMIIKIFPGRGAKI